VIRRSRRAAIRLHAPLWTSVILVPLLAACGGPATHVGVSATRRVPRTTTSTTRTVSSSSAVVCSNASVVASWSLTRRAEQLVVVPVEETEVPSIAPAVQDGVGGIILFGSDAPSNLGPQLAAVESDGPGGLKPLVMTDEEGGEVQRMANLVGNLPWPRTMASTMTAAQVEALAESTAKSMAENRVTMDLGPVLDVADGPGPDAEHTDGPRSFSDNPSVASEYGIAFAHGLQAGGVIPVVKHFPGEGGASANTDEGPAATPPLAELQRVDLLPFEAAIKAGLPAVMVGNATVPGLTSMPASLSSSVIQGLLESQLGFNGLILTDSLSAGAISALGMGIEQASVDAIGAGADMVLFNSTNPVGDSQSIVNQIVTAVEAGTISSARLDDAVDHVVAAKRISLC